MLCVDIIIFGTFSRIALLCCGRRGHVTRFVAQKDIKLLCTNLKSRIIRSHFRSILIRLLKRDARNSLRDCDRLFCTKGSKKCARTSEKIELKAPIRIVLHIAAHISLTKKMQTLKYPHIYNMSRKLRTSERGENDANNCEEAMMMVADKKSVFIISKALIRYSHAATAGKNE